jgi:hypothetical protein
LRRYTKAAALTAQEREKQKLGARVTELDRVVAAGEACLRDAEHEKEELRREAEHEKEEVRRKYRRATATEQAGRVTAEATVGVLREEVTRLHSALERVAAAGAAVSARELSLVPSTVDCMTSPVSFSGGGGGGGLDELTDTTKMDCSDSPTTTSSVFWVSPTKRRRGGFVEPLAAVAAAGVMKTPGSVKSSAARIEAAAQLQAVAAAQAGRHSPAMSIEDSACGDGGGGGRGRSDRDGPASIESKPANKAVMFAVPSTDIHGRTLVDMAPATYPPECAKPLEYSPLTKPGYEADATEEAEVGGSNPSVVSLAAHFASAADGELTVALTGAWACLWALVAMASTVWCCLLALVPTVRPLPEIAQNVLHHICQPSFLEPTAARLMP